jgi:hypothetical protein
LFVGQLRAATSTTAEPLGLLAMTGLSKSFSLQSLQYQGWDDDSRSLCTERRTWIEFLPVVDNLIDDVANESPPYCKRPFRQAIISQSK